MGWDHINFNYKSLPYIFEINVLNTRAPARKFQNKKDTIIYNLIERIIHDEYTIKVLILNNEIGITAIHSFSQIYKNELVEMELSKFDKQVIGFYIDKVMISLGFEEPIRKYKGDSIIKYGKLYRIRN